MNECGLNWVDFLYWAVIAGLMVWLGAMDHLNRFHIDNEKHLSDRLWEKHLENLQMKNDLRRLRVRAEQLQTDYKDLVERAQRLEKSALEKP